MAKSSETLYEQLKQCLDHYLTITNPRPKNRFSLFGLGKAGRVRALQYQVKLRQLDQHNLLQETVVEDYLAGQFGWVRLHHAIGEILCEHLEIKDPEIQRRQQHLMVLTKSVVLGGAELPFRELAIFQLIEQRHRLHSQSTEMRVMPSRVSKGCSAVPTVRS